MSILLLILQALAPVVELILKSLAGAIVQAAPDTTEVAKPDMQVKKAMENKIKAALKIATSSILILMLAGGCFTKTVYVEAGTPVKLRQSVPNVLVWIPDSKGKLTAGEVTIPEGWWACNLSSTDLK